MASVLHKNFKATREKIRKNVLEDLTEIYSDPAEWAESSDDLVSFAVFYDRACDRWFNSTLILDFAGEAFGRQFLLAPTTAVLDEIKFQDYHHSLLQNYAIDRVAVSLIMHNTIDRQWLKTASDHHCAYLNGFDYTTESAVIAELDTNSMLSTMVPQIMVNQLLGVESLAMRLIDPELQASEKIWQYAWRLLYGMHLEDETMTDQAWHNLLRAWKSGFATRDFHASNISHLVLMYFLYCQAQDRSFDLNDLSQTILADARV